MEYERRREGDVAIALADISLADKELDWRPELSLDTMMTDYWRFVRLNPNGYAESEWGETQS